MCGIAGIFHYRQPERAVDREALARMTRALAHRGPDGEGFHTEPGLGLGHRRLAIVDLSATGAQPMTEGTSRRWIVYNGELYNHLGYRPALEREGHRFRGTSDTETMLALLASRGPEALQGSLGIFALAYWDRDARALLLARDPLGVKQLYVHDDGETLLFASEVKALLVHGGVPRRMDPEAVNQYLHFHTPLFERTFLRSVRQLRAGEWWRVTAGGTRRRTYWSVEDFTPREGTDEDDVAALRGALAEVVRDQLLSDVPVGAFFSGGIDSTAVAAFAARAGKPPRCFGVHFTGQGVIDERPYQEAAARALGLELELVTLEGEDFPEVLPRLLYQQDQPVIGAALVPMDAVAALAARRVKVCVGGQAADELFGGYARYGMVHPLAVARGWVRGRGEGSTPTPGTAAVGGNLWKQLAERRTLWRLAHTVGRGLRGSLDWRSRYFNTVAKVPEARWGRVFGDPSVVSRARCEALFRDTVDRSPATDPADRAMHWDVLTYLTGLFHQDDRMSMAHSLESRVPLADPRLVRFAFHSRFDRKFRAGASKWLLRQAVADVIPEAVLNRRKVGFDTPAERWMRGAHNPWVREVLLGRRARERGLWDARGLRRTLDDTADPLWFDVTWKALCIELWARQVLDTPAPGVP